MRPITLLTTILTLTLWLLSKDNPQTILENPMLSLSQTSALLGTLYLSLTTFLATRLRLLENLSGGLDRLYKHHRTLGIISFILLLNHPVALIAKSLPSTQTAMLYILPAKTLSYNFGIFALWAMSTFIILTLYAHLPYHIWKKTHNFMGLAILLALLHVWLIPSDVSRYLPLRYWMLGLNIAALTAATYKRFLYHYFGPRFTYEIAGISRHADFIELYLKPRHQPMSYHPGQFVFMSLKSKRVKAELHPFSISSHKSPHLLRLTIKILGDYTLGLREAKRGDQVYLWGPYGQFLRKAPLQKNIVMIAGGIGITPFTSYILSKSHLGGIQESQRLDFPEVNPPPTDAPFPNSTATHLFYCARHPEDCLYHKELEKLSHLLPNFHYHQHLSSLKGRLTTKTIQDTIPNHQTATYYLCGPHPMMTSLSTQLTKDGIPKKNIIYEDFNFIN